MTNRQESVKELRRDLGRVLLLPVTESVDEIERIYGVRLTPEEAQGITYKELILRQLAIRGASGDMRAINQILDRLLGKPVQTNENINTNVTYYDFLMQLVEDDKKAELGVIEAEAKVEELPAPAGSGAEEEKDDDDILGDLL
jgi:hypothetical protein